jgi:hypothetical protein
MDRLQGIRAMNSQNRKIFFLSIIMILLVSLLLMNGCDNGEIGLKGDSEVEVCNNDDEEYRVKLHWDEDGRIIDEFTLGEAWDLSDRCDEFEGLPEGWYHITIYEDRDKPPTDTSDDFYLDNDDKKYFIIDDSGEIKQD